MSEFGPMGRLAEAIGFDAAVKRPDAVADHGVLVRCTLIVADIFDPGRGMVALDPDIGILEVAHKRPLPGAVAMPYAAPLRHHVQEGWRVALANAVGDVLITASIYAGAASLP